MFIKGNSQNNTVEAEELVFHIGREVRMHGAVHKIRRMSGFAFVLLRTKRMVVQCIYIPEEAHFSIEEIAEGDWLIVKGRVESEPRSKTGYEVHLLDIKVLSRAVGEAPVVINGKGISATLDTLIDLRPLTLRNEKERAIFKLQEGLARGFREYLAKNQFTEVHTPKIVFAGAEGGANLFQLPYFGKEAYLTQSPQFYKQALVGVFERVFEIGPVFRAEKHDTARHLNEYTSCDMEMGFIESFRDLMETETELLRYAFELLQNEYTPETTLLNVKIPQISDIPAIPFMEAKDILERKLSYTVTDYEDFEPEEEKKICEYIQKETGSEFVFVTHYPSSKRPFYAMDDPENLDYTLSFDLLFRGTEVTTGGQRIHDYNMQVNKMREKDMDISQFESYLMAHKYGLPPHGGLGLGLERLTMRLLNQPNIRLSRLFPRDMGRLTP